MTSIHSSISIETGLATHFNGYKIITLHLKGILYNLTHDSQFFAYQNITEFFISIHFAFIYSDILNKLATIIYSFCLNGFQIIYFLTLKSIQT